MKVFDNIKRAWFSKETYICFFSILMVCLAGCDIPSLSEIAGKEEVGTTIGFTFGRLLVSSLLGLPNQVVAI